MTLLTYFCDMEMNVNWDDWKDLGVELLKDDDEKEASVRSHKKIRRPSLLWEIACDYFQHIDENPWTDIDYKGKDNLRVKYDRKMPYTWQGLNMWLMKYKILTDLDHYRNNTQGLYDNFRGVCELIKKCIYEQKSSGATSGFFNVAIIKAELGLADKVESRVEATVKQEIDYSQLSESALNEIAKQLDKKPKEGNV